MNFQNYDEPANLGDPAQDNWDGSYFQDSNQQQSQQTQQVATAPQFDPAKYVPVEQFNQLQQQFQQVAPVVQGLQNVFAPQQQSQEPQFAPLNEVQRLQQTVEQMQKTQNDQLAQSHGLPSWDYGVSLYGALLADPSAAQKAQQVEQYLRNGDMGSAATVLKSHFGIGKPQIPSQSVNLTQGFAPSGAHGVQQTDAYPKMTSAQARGYQMAARQGSLSSEQSQYWQQYNQYWQKKDPSNMFAPDPY